MPNNVIHQPKAVIGTLKTDPNIEIEVVNTLKDIGLQLLAINNTLSLQTNPQCPPDSKCFAILFSAYTIGACVLGGPRGSNIKVCNSFLKEYCEGEDFKEILQQLECIPVLADLFTQVTSQLQKNTLDCRAERIVILNAFILGVIKWCENQNFSDS